MAPLSLCFFGCGDSLQLRLLAAHFDADNHVRPFKDYFASAPEVQRKPPEMVRL